MEKRKVRFENSGGRKLCGILSAHSRDAPIIALCHGFGRSKEGWTHLELERVLNEGGISTFRFDFFGHGESEGELEDITMSEAVDDVLSAIRFLKAGGYGRVGLFGSSFGGMACIVAASRSDDIYILSLKSPVSSDLGRIISGNGKYNLDEWKKKGFIDYERGSDGSKFRLNYSFIEDSEKNDGCRAAEKIKVPAIIVHGGDDKVVPLEQSQKVSSIIRDCKLVVIEGCDHRYTKEEHKKRLIKEISGFIMANSG